MLNVEIYTPEKTVFKGEAAGVQMPGASGLFEVLKGHAPLISALTQGTIRVTRADGQDAYTIENGFVEVLNDNINILVEGVE
ncbi:MAG: ATP synthase F1 subunit epsilon [Saprospiraceae bacterium]|nr:ATP synthase F1 subunit epsilon [Saprospiraceae bacterium]